MLHIPGYQIQSSIFESTHSQVYRGLRTADQLPIVLKILTKAYPSPEEITRYRLEYEITRGFSSQRIIRVYDLQQHQDTFFLALEDFGGESLAMIAARGRLALADALDIAIETARGLAEIHAAAIIHKDINPANIVLNPATGQLKIIDFGIASDRSRERLSPKTPASLEGNLAYISPEQTGRMNRSLDYRTDYYSFGVTLYQLLTGALPFATQDPLELLHHHLALQPAAPHERDPAIAPALSAIVMRLLAKTAEDRYQSAQGIVADLERCRLQLAQTGQIAPFALGQHDRSEQFQISEALYGRERELAALLGAFARVAGTAGDAGPGRAELLLVSGYSGIGKSALVQEIYRPITRQRGYFIAGKFDQYQRNIPYFAIAQALQALLRQLLTESEGQLAAWRARLLAALGQHGQVMIQIVPALELVIGPQPAAPALPAVEALNRLNQLFLRFTQLFARPEHPLAIFLDDLQWADAASLKLIELLALADDQSLLLIGAYRDNEVPPAHPLLRMVEAVEAAGGRVGRLALAALGLPELSLLVAATLHCSPAAALPLAELLRQKTGGNPFFVNEFLKSLYAEGLIAFGREAGAWRWSIAQIQAREMTDNVVDLMAEKIQKLDPAAQRALSLAACVGNQFDLATLAAASGQPQRPTAQALRSAIGEGLIVPLGSAHLSAELAVPLADDHPAIEYRFAHDRIQQAAYSLIPPAERAGVHWQIGQRLLEQTPPDMQQLRIFDIVNQLNQGRESARLPAQRDTLARLNLRAGRQAQASAAFVSAFRYLRVALDTLADESWQTDYALSLEIYGAATELAYLSGEPEQMEQLGAILLDHAASTLDSIVVYAVKSQAMMVQGQLLPALQLTLRALELLDIRFPSPPGPADVQRAMAAAQAQLAGRPIGGLIDLPPMTDPRMLAAMQLLSGAISAAHAAGPLLFPLIVLKQVQLSVEYGNAPISPFSYAVYGLILCGVALEIDYGYQFSLLGLRLLDTLDAPQIRARVMLSVHAGAQYWKEHLRATFRPLQECYQAAIDNGDLDFAGYTALHHCDHAYFAGLPLPDLAALMAAYRGDMLRLKLARTADAIAIFQQAAHNLTQASAAPGSLRAAAYDEAAQVPLLERANDRQVLFLLYLNKLILCYLFADSAGAMAAADAAATYIDGVAGQVSVAIFRLYDSLARLLAHPAAAPARQAALLDQVDANQALMQLWSAHAPMNYQHKWELVAAERHRVLGHALEAMECYDRAIALARASDYLQEEAMANELAARFYLGREQTMIARAYMQEARYAYLRWGAAAKVQDLDGRYPALLAQRTAPWRLSTDITSSDNYRLEALDLGTVLKASQAIASEIVRDRLLDRLMSILIEHAGAQTGYLVMPADGEWRMAAIGAVGAATTVIPPLPILMVRDDDSSPLPASIINYVARTHERVVLRHAAHEGSFMADPWVVRRQSKSLLCAPLMHQAQLIGIIFLENNLVSDTFTPERMEILNLLSAQAAISISNSRLLRQQTDLNAEIHQLNAELEDRVATRTAQLEAANRELEAFSYSVSHDLRAPLRAIDGFSRLLQEDYGAQLSAEAQRYLHIVQENAKRMGDLIDDLLALSRTSRQELRRQTVAPNAMVQTVIDDLAPELAERQVAFVVADLPSCNADPSLLRQVWVNLLSNAVKYSRQRPLARIEVGHQTLAGESAYFVRDNGAGFDMQYADKLFGVFQRLHRPQEFEGTGIGLAIVQRIVQRHGGRIWAEAAIDRGATFFFTLSENSHL